MIPAPAPALAPPRDALGAAIEASLAPFDRARRALYAGLGRRGAAWFADRDARVALYGAIVVLGALVTTAFAPLWSLALGPIALGVPHLIADVRYLWVRPGLHKRLGVVLAMGLPLLAGALTSRTAWGFVACAGAVVVARGASPSRRALVGIASAALLALALTHRHAVDLAFAHAHNFIAVALWWAWRPRRGRAHLVPLALFVAASAVIALGLLAPLASLAASCPATGDPLERHVAQLAPFAEPVLATRLVLLFAFAQSVQYGVWLRLVPEDDRDKKAPRPFVSSFRELRRDFGAPLLVVAGLLAVALAAWATRDLAAARTGYLRFAGFHGQLELAVAALLLLEGRARGVVAGSP